MQDAARKAMFAKLHGKNRIGANDITRDTYYVEGEMDIPLFGRVKGGVKREVLKSNPHLVEDDDMLRVEGEYRGHMVSRFVAPPPK